MDNFGFSYKFENCGNKTRGRAFGCPRKAGMAIFAFCARTKHLGMMYADGSGPNDVMKWLKGKNLLPSK